MRYLIWLLAIIVLIAVLVVLLIPGGSKEVPGTSLSFAGYASTDVTAKLTVDGPENAEQNHQSFQIDVGKNSVSYTQFAGYQGRVVNQQTYTNNQAAYNVFLQAIYYAGFTDGNTSPKLTDDTGICALGDRYIFELVDGSRDIERFWSTSCNGPRTYNGDLSLTLSLFQNQVPDYSSLTQNFSF